MIVCRKESKEPYIAADPQKIENFVNSPVLLASWSISRKLALLLLVVFLSASAILVASGLNHRKHEVWEAKKNALFLVQSLAAQQEQIVIGTKQMLSTLAQLPQMQRLDGNACSDIFRRLQERYPFYSIIAATTPDGNIFASSIPFEPGVNISDHKHFRDVKQTLRFSAGEYTHGRISEVHSLHYSYPVLDAEDNLICIVTAAFRLDEYARYIEKANLPEDSIMGIIDHAGVHLYQLPQEDATRPGKALSMEFFDFPSGSSSEGTTERVAPDGVDRLYAFKRLSLEEGSSPYMYIMVGISKDRILEKENHEMLTELLILGIAAFAAMGLAWFLGRQTLIKPVNRLVTAAQRFGKGELGTRSGLPHWSNELGKLAQSFDDMASLLEVRDAERRTAEKALGDNEKRYRLLFNSGNDAVFVHEGSTPEGLPGRFIEVNDIACMRLGYTREELLTMTPLDIDAPDTLPYVPRIMEQLVKQGGAIWEGVHVTRDGRRIPVEISNRLFEFDGKPAVLSTARDISERKAADEALRITSFSVEYASDPIYWIGPKAQILYANRAACRSVGYSKEELLAMSVFDLDPIVRSEDWAESFEEWNQGKSVIVESIHRRKDGSTFPIEIDINSLAFKEIGFNFVNVKDISERKRAEAEREKLETQLFHAQKMESIGRLAGGVAHDFNNMLGVIIGYAEMALDQIDPSEPIHNNLDEILKAADRSAELTRQLLAFARKQVISPKVLDLNEIVSNMLKMLQRLIGENIDLVWLPAPVLWKVKIDPSQVDQVLANLAINARDAIREMGSLTLKTCNLKIDKVPTAAGPGLTPGEYVLISVKDTGSGMSKDVLDKIFEPFFTTKSLGKGTGLGLATVYGIIQQNGGYITVSSEVGDGTNFEIYLPRAEVQEEEAVTGKSESKPHRGSGTILLVEDEESLLNLGSAILQNLGYTVLPARTPGEAIRLAEQHAASIRLLITDVVMPEMNGRELVERLHEMLPGLRYIYMSGYPADMIASGGQLDEGIHFIQKPFSVQQMSEGIRRVLEN